MKLVTSNDLQFNGMYFVNVEVLSQYDGKIAFKYLKDDGKVSAVIETTHPYTLTGFTSLSCGHKLEYCYEGDRDQAGIVLRCRACDSEKGA